MVLGRVKNGVPGGGWVGVWWAVVIEEAPERLISAVKLLVADLRSCLSKSSFKQVASSMYGLVLIVANIR